MITDHKYRESNTRKVPGCSWLGTCGRPRDEHAESVDLDSPMRRGGLVTAAERVKK